MNFREYITPEICSTEIAEVTIDIDDMIEDIEGLTGKGKQIAWDFMENLSRELKLVPGDSTPADYLNKMADGQIKILWNKIEKYI